MFRSLILFCALIFFATSTFGQTPSRTKALETKSGTVLELVEGEFLLDEGLTPSKTTWQIERNPNIDLGNKTGLKEGEYRTLMGRFYFSTADVGTGPIAIYTLGTRDNFTVSINGDEIFRNFADIHDQKNPWYRPFFIPVPDRVLKADVNEIAIRTYSRYQVGIGHTLIGSSPEIQSYYKSRYFWHILAPIAANYTMLLLGGFAFMFWLARRQEVELLWISIANAFWFLRNQRYFFDEVPSPPDLFPIYSAFSIHASYFAAASTAAFYLCFIKFKHRKTIIACLFLAGLPILLANIWTSLATLISYVSGTLIISSVGVIALRDLFRHRNLERGVLGLGMILLPFASLHDIIELLTYYGDGHATYLVVFCGFFYAVAFLISFGKRVLTAFSDLGRSNQILEQSIAETRAELAQSEAKRRELVVSQALTNERSRLMQEMHDGIGSNLTTALAVARQQNHPRKTITVLKRALGDLKLTVDSLEPIEGDLVALIGNLRHRMARDLLDAGISCKWEVEDCKPLTWLDATNALHVLRIHNEAISNVLSHSEATEMRIGCIETVHEGNDGISTYIADNGKGFDVDLEKQGKGLANMRARASSLHGVLTCDSQPGRGTIIRLWLPHTR